MLRNAQSTQNAQNTQKSMPKNTQTNHDTQTYTRKIREKYAKNTVMGFRARPLGREGRDTARNEREIT